MKATVLIGVLLAAVLVPAAASKGVISRVELCGAEGCHALAIPRGLHEWPGGAGPAADPPAVSPFFEVRVTLGGHTHPVWYVPAARRFAFDQHGSLRWAGVWQTIDQLIARSARRYEPRRARAIAASIDGRRVPGDASGYLDLFDMGTTVGRGSESHRFFRIRVTTEPPSPWSHDELWFFPSSGVLQRGTELVKLPPGVAADLRAGKPIGGSASGGFGWPLLGSVLVAGFAVTGLGLWRRARRPR